MTGQITAFAQSLSGYVVGDEPVKAVLATSTFAQMEVSSYRILVAAAQAVNLGEVATLCRIAAEIDRGIFEGAGFRFHAETYRPGDAGCCFLHVRPGA